MLNRDAPYVQIIEHYRQEIRDGRLQDGDMLPSGREIAAQFGVSLATAAKAATGLQSLGLVTPRPGAGTVITAARPPADRARGGPLLITLASRTPSQPGDKARVLEAGLADAPQAVAAQLGVEPFTRVVRRRQATIRDGATVAVLTSWYPAPLAEAIPGLLSQVAAHRGHRRLPASLGRGLGIRPAPDVRRGPRVRDQARLARRRGPQPPVRRRRHRHRIRRADRPRRHPHPLPVRIQTARRNMTRTPLRDVPGSVWPGRCVPARMVVRITARVRDVLRVREYVALAAVMWPRGTTWLSGARCSSPPHACKRRVADATASH